MPMHAGFACDRDIGPDSFSSRFHGSATEGALNSLSSESLRRQFCVPNRSSVCTQYQFQIHRGLAILNVKTPRHNQREHICRCGITAILLRRVLVHVGGGHPHGCVCYVMIDDDWRHAVHREVGLCPCTLALLAIAS